MAPKRRRGQVSVENQVLIGLVLVVMIVCLAAVLNILRPQAGKRGFVGFSQLIPTDWAVSNTGKIYMSVRSDGNSPVVILRNGVNCTFPGRVQCDLGPTFPTGDNNITVTPGQQAIIEVDCAGLNYFDVGEEFELDSVINYTDLDTHTPHQSVGKIYGFVEDVPPGWMPPTTTSTTGTTLPQCFYTECTLPGQIDIQDCSRITYRGVVGSCQYCPQDASMFPDGKRRCWFNGACGSSCSSSNDCQQDEFLNLCKACVNGTCQEINPGPQCGPCPQNEGGTLNSTWCDKTSCSYCFHQWIQTGPNPGQGEDSYTCSPPQDCGLSCSIGADDCECSGQCPHCQADTSNPVQGLCTAGDCGRRCGSGAPNPTCDVGCGWCNLTTDTCQMGDCCKECGPLNPDAICALGCDTCVNGHCQKTDIGVTIVVDNWTKGGKMVPQNQPIEVNVQGNSNAGVAMLLLSNGTYVSAYDENCTSLAQERNQQGPITDPFNDPWLQSHGITWLYQYNCNPPDLQICNYLPPLNTSEANVGNYCFFALAQKYSQTGSGKWSILAADYIQVGYLWVYLVSPRPI